MPQPATPHLIQDGSSIGYRLVTIRRSLIGYEAGPGSGSGAGRASIFLLGARAAADELVRGCIGGFV